MSGVINWLFGNAVPASMSSNMDTKTAVFIIFGLVALFLVFILKIWKIYYESKKAEEKEIQREKDIKTISTDQNPNMEVIKIALAIQEKMSDMSDKYAGKYVPYDEFEEHNKEVFDEVEKVKKEVLDLINKMNKEIDKIKKELKTKFDEQKSIHR